MAQFTRIKTWASGEVLYASDLNAEFDNLLNGFTPAQIDGASANVSAMQAAVDPGESGTESLASTVLGEIQRLRYAIKEMKGTSYWYQTTSGDMTNGLPVTFADQGLRNVGLAFSVSGNALTIALKQANGSSDPASGSGTVSVAFRSATLTSGAWTQRNITSAMSLVVPSGATLNHRDTISEFGYVYLIDNAGTPELAVSSILFDEGNRVSTTAIDTSSDGVLMYSTSARTNVGFRLIGRFVSNQTTAGTWASVPTTASPLVFHNTKPIYEHIMAYAGTTYGSTNTKIPIFTTNWANSTANGLITYTTNATDGASFTANYPCLADVHYMQQGGTSNNRFAGLLLNCSGADLTTDITSLTPPKVIALGKYSYAAAGASACVASASLKLNKGDVIHPSSNGDRDTISAFSIKAVRLMYE